MIQDDDAGPTTLYPDRGPAAMLAVVAIAAIVAGAWLVWRGWAFGGVATAVAGLVVLVGALGWLIPSRAFLHLTDRGFIYSTAFNPRRVDWVDVERFAVAQVDGEDRVAWDYSAHYPAERDDRARTRAWTGFEALLPRCCRADAATLVALLTGRKARAGR